MIIDRQDALRLRKSTRRPAKKLNERAIDYLCSSIDNAYYSGNNIYDIMLDEASEPNVSCEESTTISVPLY